MSKQLNRAHIAKICEWLKHFEDGDKIARQGNDINIWNKSGCWLDGFTIY